MLNAGIMKSVLIYAALVGTPVVGLLGILKTGERIVPPPSIGGAWTVETESSSAPASGCMELGLGQGPPQLDISQSGTHAQMTLLKQAYVVLSLSLRGDSILGMGSARSSPECSPSVLILRGRVARIDGRERLTGVFTWAGCDGCPDVSFVARRQTDAEAP